MAQDLQKPAKPAAAASGSDDEERITVEDLTAGARGLLGVSPIAAAGALATSDRKTHTLPQAQALVEQFMKREVT